MGRKKQRVAVEEDQAGTVKGPLDTNVDAGRPAITVPFPPPLPFPVPIGTNNATRIVAPNDPRRKPLVNTPPDIPMKHPLMMIKEEVNGYCQPASFPSTANMVNTNDNLTALSSPPPHLLHPSNILLPSPTIINNSQSSFPITMASSLNTTLMPSAPPTINKDSNKSTISLEKVMNTGELIEEDVYTSDGSDWENEEDEEENEKREEDEENTLTSSGDKMELSGEDDEEQQKESKRITKDRKSNNKTDSLEIILTTSKMGLIRKGSMRQQLLLQAQQHNLQSKQWIRGKNPYPRDDPIVTEGEEEDIDDSDEKLQGKSRISRHDPENTEEEIEEEEEEEEESEEKKLANMDPAHRAAYLLAEKQRKIEEAKIAARILESSENAGRDPCLFSKRTAFDIRMDQIEEKPWLRVGGDITDYFNYGLTEEDWMDYAQQQLEVRQELTDANRQKRTPDPTIIPVVPRAPRKQQPRVAVVTKKDAKNDDDEDAMLDVPAVGPSLPDLKVEQSTSIKNEIDSTNAVIADAVAPVESESKANLLFVDIGGGAWGAGAAPGSVLAKLIEDQDKVSSGKPPPTMPMTLPPPPPIPNLPPPPLPPKSDIPTDLRRLPPQPESIDSQGDSFMHGSLEDNNPFFRDPSNRRSGAGRWGDSNDFSGPMHNDFSHPSAMPYHRHGEWRDGRNNFSGPSQVQSNQRFPPPNSYRAGPPSNYPPQSAPNNAPPMYHDPHFIPGPGMNFPPGPPQEYHNPRGPPRRMGPGSPWEQQGPAYPNHDGFEFDHNWRRSREEFTPMPFGGPNNAGGRFPPQGFGGNNFRR